MPNADYLQQLNEYQRNAVVSEAKSLQILAGPGSGKTRVLTTRVAWLVKQKNLRPSSVVVVTFTRKAAREMAERLEQPQVLGLPRSNYLRMGTFHSFCCRLLRRYVDYTSLKRNFVIADESKSKQLMDNVVKELRKLLSPLNRDRKEAEFRKFINDAKAQGIDHHTYMGQHGDDPLKKDTAMVYAAYEEKLERANMIDFNGILLKARDLMKQCPQTVDSISHVLVDEFQDTNSLQYELLLLLTRRGEKPLTIVGDPDQSIFGWRFADKKNFDNMEFDYKETVVVNLKQNYRSTKNILSNATRVVSLDTKRKPREFFTDNHDGIPISTLHTDTETDEASAVAQEIKRIVKYSNGLINYKDIAILFRMNFLTLNFEQALLRAGVPFVLVSGTRFLDRMEVKDILAYLSFFYNPMDVPAFQRLINTPKRGLGDTSVNKILALADAQNWTLIETLQHLINRHPLTSSIRISNNARDALQSLLTLHLEIDEKMQRMEPPASLLNWIVEATGYLDYLKSNYEKDHESRTMNVKELINFAHRQVQDQLDAENLIDPVGQFLEAVTLCGDEKEHDDAKEGKVSLLTIHASKGLEWSTVFVAGCEEGILPMTQTEDPDEESRLMYVAMTRAKCFLYCTSACQRQQWGKTNFADLSSFICALPESGYQCRTPAWNADVRHWVAQVLRLSYMEDGNLNLEDNGSEFSKTKQRFNDYNFYGGSYDDYDECNDYGYEQDSNPFGGFTFGGNRRGTQYTDRHQNRRNLPLEFGIRSARALMLPVPPSTTAPRKKEPKTKSNVKTEPNIQQLGGATIKAGNRPQQTNPALHSIFQQQPIRTTTKTSGQKIKLEPNIMDSVSLKQQRTAAINIKRESCTTTSTSTFIIPKKRQKQSNTTTTLISIDQCVMKGLQLAGQGKLSFTMEHAVSSVENLVKENQIKSSHGNNIKELVNEQLNSLVQKGSLFRINKADGLRFFVAE